MGLAVASVAVTHYEVLGVARSAAPEEVRRAYLTLARQHHPDYHTGDGAATQQAAERRMRSINEAWRVLSDGDRRRQYDEQTRPPNSPGVGWVPPDDGDDWDPSMLDDTPINAVRPRQAFTLAPLALFAAGVLLLCVGVVTSLAPALALGLLAILLSALLFVVVPFMTMAESRRRDLGG
jgi:curved DNA-binding protein CbpA